MSFHSFLGTRGHSITFSINTMDMLCFIFCSQDYLNWLTTDILLLLSVMQILTVGDSKGHYFQRIHTCLFHPRRHSGVQIGYRAITCHVTRWHFIRTIFSCEYGWVQTGHLPPVSICAARCLHCRTRCFLSFFILPHVFLYLCPFLSLWRIHLLTNTVYRRENCSIQKENCS